MDSDNAIFPISPRFRAAIASAEQIVQRRLSRRCFFSGLFQQGHALPEKLLLLALTGDETIEQARAIADYMVGKIDTLPDRSPRPNSSETDQNTDA
ncbi:MAG: hypothetical protein AAF889_00020 [Cyanobacteria bacterium P01_D01_bin.73]